MQERFPQEFAWRDQDKLRYRYPWGESYIDIMTRLRPALSALEDEHNVVVVGHQAVLRCMLGYFLDAKLGKKIFEIFPKFPLLCYENQTTFIAPPYLFFMDYETKINLPTDRKHHL